MLLAICISRPRHTWARHSQKKQRERDQCIQGDAEKQFRERTSSNWIMCKRFRDKVKGKFGRKKTTVSISIIVVYSCPNVFRFPHKTALSSIDACSEGKQLVDYLHARKAFKTNRKI